MSSNQAREELIEVDYMSLQENMWDETSPLSFLKEKYWANQRVQDLLEYNWLTDMRGFNFKKD
jgi:hypothetical protein